MDSIYFDSQSVQVHIQVEALGSSTPHTLVQNSPVTELHVGDIGKDSKECTSVENNKKSSYIRQVRKCVVECVKSFEGVWLMRERMEAPVV